jgi:hypothetical protein
MLTTRPPKPLAGTFNLYCHIANIHRMLWANIIKYGALISE